MNFTSRPTLGGFLFSKAAYHLLLFSLFVFFFNISYAWCKNIYYCNILDSHFVTEVSL